MMNVYYFEWQKCQYIPEADWRFHVSQVSAKAVVHGTQRIWFIFSTILFSTPRKNLAIILSRSLGGYLSWSVLFPHHHIFRVFLWNFSFSRFIPIMQIRHILIKKSHLNLLLWNCWTKLNQTWQGWSPGLISSKMRQKSIMKTQWPSDHSTRNR